MVFSATFICFILLYYVKFAFFFSFTFFISFLSNLYYFIILWYIIFLCHFFGIYIFKFFFQFYLIFFSHYFILFNSIVPGVNVGVTCEDAFFVLHFERSYLWWHPQDMSWELLFLLNCKLCCVFCKTGMIARTITLFYLATAAIGHWLGR